MTYQNNCYNIVRAFLYLVAVFGFFLPLVSYNAGAVLWNSIYIDKYMLSDKLCFWLQIKKILDFRHYWRILFYFWNIWLIIVCVVQLCVFAFWVSSYLRHLCLLAHSGVQRILCCVFALFFLVLCAMCCQFLWIVHFWLPLQYSLTFIYQITMSDYRYVWEFDCPFSIL